ncbi:MAG: hypothetical protein RLZZ401_433 [Pseudomonadota bacterium]|jgi:hypothetical protein
MRATAWFTLFFVATNALLVCCNAQNLPKNLPAAPAPCPVNLSVPDLLGHWLVQWPGGAATEPTTARLQLVRNPDFSDSLVGTLNMGEQRHDIAGDVETNTLTLEQSANGTSISANWALTPLPGSCGRALGGLWIRAADGNQRDVQLRRPAQW